MFSARKKDVVYEEVLRRLFEGVYRFGDSIAVRELTEICNVSRQPVMTALNSLSAEGFLNITAQVGCSVIAPSIRDIGDFFILFGRLEAAVAELAAKRRTASQVDALEEINRKIGRLVVSEDAAGENYRLLNREFHSLMHAMADSPTVMLQLSNLFDRSDFYIAQTSGFEPHLADAATEHQDIIDALRRRDESGAGRAAAAHLGQVREQILRKLEGEAA